MSTRRADRRVIAVIGATGLQGGAVARRLLEEGWHVRALTRKPRSKRARATAALGAEVIQADMHDPSSLERAFDGVQGVYSVQNPHTSGYEGELTQARNVIDVAKLAGVPHVVYGSAGIGLGGTGVGSWETKVKTSAYMRTRGLPVTILRPMAFMELMSVPKYFPPASTWHVMPKLMGANRPVGWLAVDDLAVIAAKAFADPARFVGRDLPLTGDVRSLNECRTIWREEMGRSPRRLPMPVPLFERLAGTDVTTMWRWLRAHEIVLDTGPARDIHPKALTVREWVARRVTAPSGSSRTPRLEGGTA